MKQYLKAMIIEQINRGQSLKKLIKLPLDYVELERLAETCTNIIDSNIFSLNHLMKEIDNRDEDNIRDIFRGFRESVREIESVEHYGITALYYQTAEVGYLNKLIQKIKQEINLPVIPPSVACISTGYYYYYSLTNVIFVPIGESEFLLHLPDLFHELGHAVLFKRDEVKLRKLQEAFTEAIETIVNHYHQLFIRKNRETAPQEISMLIRHIHSQWKYWVEEFFCDLFALYTLGPAYAWSHLHLTAKKSDNIYRFSKFFHDTHPSDEARMRMLNIGLDLLGFKAESAEISAKWKIMPTSAVAKPVPEYQYAYPDNIMKALAELFLQGLGECSFSILSPERLKTMDNDSITKQLNNAWDLFWKDPKAFRKWEEKSVESLKKQFGVCESPKEAVSTLG